MFHKAASLMPGSHGVLMLLVVLGGCWLQWGRCWEHLGTRCAAAGIDSCREKADGIKV
jgi:hypothetical protein